MLDLINNIAVTRIGRIVCKKIGLKDFEDTYNGHVKPTVTTLDDKDANLVSSLLPNGMHAPAIDLDIPVHLVASSTPGHFHLFIDKEMTWKQYQNLLMAMRDAGIVEPGYYSQSVRHEQSYLRLPTVKKIGKKK